MKRKYKPWLIILFTEFVLIFLMDKANIQFHSLTANAIGAFLFFLPVVVLLVLASKDEAIPAKRRTLCKFAYCFLVFCYLLTLVLKLLIG